VQRQSQGSEQGALPGAVLAPDNSEVARSTILINDRLEVEMVHPSKYAKVVYREV
jgi:hypothetical protein